MPEINPVAVIHTAFSSKFGIPRQSGLTDTTASIVFCGEYRCEEALRGIEAYSHLWLIWGFSEAKIDKFMPTVRPPRLGGNKRMGVFATRSPFRPNSLGLSCVKLEKVQKTENDGTVLIVSGADMLDGTPIYDIKPYLPFADAYPSALGGFADKVKEHSVKVCFDCVLPTAFSAKEKNLLTQILEQDPRPQYIDDKFREYAFEFLGYNIRFVCDNITLTVKKITEEAQNDTDKTL